MGDYTLHQQYPSLNVITRKKNVSIAYVFSRIPLNISFRRGLMGNNLNLWHNLVGRVATVRLNDHEDKFRWSLHQNGIFSVKSMYQSLISDNRVWYDTTLWKLKIPLKIKIFMWYVKRKVVLTKDNLARRNWQGNKMCAFCSQQETIQHLFFNYHFAKNLWRVVQCTFNIDTPTSVGHLFNDWACSVGSRLKKFMLVGASALCWALWTCKNDIVFDKVPMKTYMQVLYRGTYWLREWAQLQKHEEDIVSMIEACRSLEAMIMHIFVNFGRRFSNRISY